MTTSSRSFLSVHYPIREWCPEEASGQGELSRGAHQRRSLSFFFKLGMVLLHYLSGEWNGPLLLSGKLEEKQQDEIVFLFASIVCKIRSALNFNQVEDGPFSAHLPRWTEAVMIEPQDSEYFAENSVRKASVRPLIRRVLRPRPTEEKKGDRRFPALLSSQSVEEERASVAQHVEKREKSPRRLLELWLKKKIV